MTYLATPPRPLAFVSLVKSRHYSIDTMFAAAAVGAVMIKYEQRQIRKRDNQRHRQATHEPQAASTTPQAVVTQAESTPTLTRLGRALRPGRRTDDAQAARSSAGESVSSASVGYVLEPSEALTRSTACIQQ